MAEQAVITTNWVAVQEDGFEEIVNTPQVAQNYTFIKWTDVTGQPSESIIPSPNQYNILLQAETVDMDAIAADPQYVVVDGTRVTVTAQTQGAFDSGVFTAVPTQQEFDTWRTQYESVKDAFDQDMWTSQDLVDAIGTTPNARTWGQITQDMSDWCAARPKGSIAFEIQPVPLPDGSVGADMSQGLGQILMNNPDYVREEDGSEPNGPQKIPAAFFDIPVARIATNGALGGVLALQLQSPLDLSDMLKGLQLPSHQRIRANPDQGIQERPFEPGQTFYAPDAFYQQNPNQWVWFNTNWMLHAGVDMTIIASRF